jgi:transcription factor STE12
MIKAEQDFGSIQYDRNGVPLARIHQRHTSMPTYMEYSPAPSFVSSQYDDYGHRAISYEPVTPPQHNLHMGSEPAYIANEDTGLYSAIPDLNTSAAYNHMMQLPPSNLVGPQFSSTRSFPSTSVYSVLEGSPTYKQRRRRSSIPASITNAIAAAAAGGNGQAQSNPQPHAAHRPSDLRRSCSAAQVDEEENNSHDSVPELTNGYNSQEREILHRSSHSGTPLPAVEEGHSDDSLGLVNGHDESPNSDNVGPSPGVNGHVNGHGDRPGPVRRARSATMTEVGPYPQKSHSCPIPSCGRLFKRLEHLKRYVPSFIISSTSARCFVLYFPLDGWLTWSPCRIDM